jgi:sporulation protein YlmC with PRC-barrel domain
MNIARDVLDEQVVDRNGREMGRVDGIVLRVRDNQPPEVSELLIGASVLGFRLHAVIGRFVRGVETALGIARDRPVRIDVVRIEEMGEHIKIDQPIGETTAGLVEDRIRPWLRRLPGSQ